MTAQDALRSNKVALIVSVDTDPALFSEASSAMPVWISGTPENLKLAREAWDKHEGYITTFDVNFSYSPSEIALGNLDTICLHHPMMTRLVVYGIPIGGEQDTRWKQNGFDLVETNSNAATFTCAEYGTDS